MDRKLAQSEVKYPVALFVRGDAEQTMVDLAADWKPRVVRLETEGFTLAAVASLVNGEPCIDFQRDVTEFQAEAFGMAHRGFVEIKAALDNATNYNWQTRRYERPN
jgi:hypothetical protein